LKPYSPSRIETFDTCQFLGKSIYIDGMKKETSDVMAGGGLFHRLAQKYYQHLIDTEQPSDIEMIESIIGANIESEPLLVIDEYGQMFRKWALSQFVGDGTWKNISTEKKMAVDEEFRPVPITNDEDWDADIFVRGIIDRLEMREIPTIIDYKTNHVLPSEKEMENSLQTRIYPMLVLKNLGIVSEVRVIFEFVRFGVSREIIVTPEQIASIEPWLKKKAAEIEGIKEYTATMNSRCEYCPAKTVCPAMKKALENDICMPSSEDGAVKLAETLIAWQEKVKSATEYLKMYISNHGVVTVGDQEYKQKVSESYEFQDAKMFVDFLIEKGIDKAAIWSMLSVGKTDFEKSMKKLKIAELIPDVVDKIGTPKISTMTKFYKVK